MKNLILLMSLSGSLFFAVYAFISWYTKKSLPTKVRLLLLKITLALYLVPFPAFKYIFPDFLWRVNRDSLDNTYFYTENYVVYSHNGYMADIAVILVWIWCIISGVVAITFIGGYLRKCVRTRKMVERCSETVEARAELEKIEKIKKELGLKQRVRFVFSKRFDSPFTFGFFSPTVVLPALIKELGDEEWDYMVRHELNHIKGHHMFIRFLAFVANLVHCFNPLAYLLRDEIYNMCEIDCDSKTIRNYSSEQRRKYVECIIDFATNSTDAHISGTVGLIGDRLKERKIQRRILEMNKPKRSRKVVSVAAVLLAAFVGSISVWAYEPAVEIEHDYDLNNNSEYFTYDDLDLSNDFDSNTGDVFVDNEGNTYNTTGVDRVICFHNYVDTTLGEHIRNSDGSCTTNFYDAKRCTKCGKVTDTVYKNKMTYETCPH